MGRQQLLFFSEVHVISGVHGYGCVCMYMCACLVCEKSMKLMVYSDMSKRFQWRHQIQMEDSNQHLSQHRNTMGHAVA